ncbi:MAG: prephenate dehydrogenase [Gammaproteobacteria bacterium]|nr:prephenate dehydrogenase [Gammaproteobacteria bacterium]
MTTGRKARPATLLLVGTGLVGGSFALAAKAHGVFSRVVGIDRRTEALDQALALGIIDDRAGDAAESRFDAACVAVPLAGIASCVLNASKSATVVFDVGSVKGPVIDALEPPPENYVPCHPIAGSEQHGPGAADGALFRNRTVVMTPTDATAAWAAAEVRRIWEAIGADVETQTPDQHDERFALLSHLPHLVAVAFMDVVGRAGSSAGAGSGFRDFTRIAAGDAEVWHDILHGNAGHVRRYLDELIEDLRSLGDAAAKGGPPLRRRIEGASRLRRAFDQARRLPATRPRD